METTICIFMDLEILSFRDCGSHSPSPWASNRSAVKWFCSVPPAMSRSINGPMKLAIFDPQSIQCWVSILWSLVLGPYLHIYIYNIICVYIYIKHGCKNLLEIAFLTSFKWGNHETRWWIFQCLITSGFFNSSLVFGRFWSPQIMAFGFKTVSLSRWWRSKFEGIPYWIYMDLLDWNRIDIN